MKQHLPAAVMLVAVLALGACQSTGNESPVTSTQAAPVGGPLIQDLQARGLEPLDTDALKALHVGNRLRHTNLVDDLEVMIAYSENGTRKISFNGKTATTNYEIADGRRCEDSVQGGTVCVTIYEIDGQYFGCDSRSEGKCDWRIEVVE